MAAGTALILGSLTAGLLLEYAVLKLVRDAGVMAHVTARSSHSAPTPTLGGVVIVLLVLAFLMLLGTEAPRLGYGLAAAGGLVALVGLVDDLVHLPAAFRLCVHVLAGAGVLWALNLSADWRLAGALLLGLVWFTNLYNFMDGIDGFAAAQCLVYVCGVNLVSAGLPGWSGDLLWVLGGASLAFMCFNWPPARIFMGDVGSGFIGLVVGAVALHAWHMDYLPLIASLILLAAFWFDASYTLCVRIVTKQPFTQAHRAHLYQRLAQRKGHLWTTCAFLAFAAAWLLPLAWLSTRSALWAAIALLAAIVPLFAACVACRAGINLEGSHAGTD